MKILSLYDGMGCGYLAAIEAGYNVERYIACENDKYCVETTKANIPIIEHVGDIFKADFMKYAGEIDLLCGGSPCTYWSIAQQPGKRETKASGLGWELFGQYVRALWETSPRFFIYENNKSMSKDIRSSICEAFGFEPIEINSALVSAQTRKRLYWVGCRQSDGSYKKVDIDQPTDRGICVRDILETYGYETKGNDKSYCLTATYPRAVLRNTLERHQRSMVAEPVRVGDYPNSEGRIQGGQAFRIYSVDGKSVSLKANAGGAGGKTGLYAIKKAGYLPTKEGKIHKSQTYRIYDTEGKAATLMSGSHGSGNTGLYAVKSPDNETHERLYEVNNGLMTVNGREYPVKLIDGTYIVRKLTVRECMRLQTVPESYKFPVSDTQAYKMLGNGWTVEVIKHLMKACFK